MDIPQTFTAETDAIAAALFERQQRELDNYQTRYVYAPFMSLDCHQVPGGSIPAGVIYPMPAPKGKINLKALPEGAQILYTISPSMGVPHDVSRKPHKDPEMEALHVEVERMRRLALERGQDPPSIGVYLHEVAPIVRAVTAYYQREGAIEVTALFGMSGRTFEKHRINDEFFSPEALDGDDTPGTALAIRKQMRRVIERTGGRAGEAGRILDAVANEILASVDRCERFCREHVRQRHLEMDDRENDKPKRYSKRDLRAIEFIGAVRREEYMQHALDQQQKAMNAIPAMLEAMEKRDRHFTQAFADMAAAMKAIAAKKN